MFGFGFGKIVLLILIIVAVWYGYKFVGRLEQNRKQRLAEQKKQASDSSSSMEKCRVCGTYVVSESAKDCGKSNCPY